MSVEVIFRRAFFASLIIIMLLADFSHAAVDLEALFDDDFEETHQPVVYDPLEPVNRFFFQLNDRLYFWVLKPVGKVYSAVLADEAVRGCVNAAFHNILAPARVVNSLLQGKFKQSGTEVARFAINTVFGAGGLGDPAGEEFGLAEADEDLGQTLGFYGVGPGLYICWPFLGPSTVRDSVGMVGDYFLNPLQYIFVNDPGTHAGLTALKVENAATLKGKDYESLVSEAFDPYISFRDIYYQYRRSLVVAAASPGYQDAVPQKDKVFFQEQCPEQGGEALFRNLAKARAYQQCLENKGTQTSVNRAQKQGRAMYLIMIDGQVVVKKKMAMVADGAGKDGQ